MGKVDEAPDELWTPPTLYEWSKNVRAIPAWLVEDWIPERGLVVMSGHEKLTKKTFTAMTLALSIAAGKRLGPFVPASPRHVLFVEEEGTETETRYRWEGICATYKVKLDKRLDIRFAFREGVGLDDSRWRADLLSYVERFKPGAIFFDNLSFLYSGDENKAAELRPVIQTLKTIRDAGTACCVLAHLNKSDGGDPKANKNKQVRGNSLIVQNADVHLALRNYETENDPVELHRQYRGQASKEDRIHWSIESEGVVIHRAEMRLEPMVSDEDPAFAAACLEALDPGEEYGLATLQRLWELPRKGALKVLHVLMERQQVCRCVTGHYKVAGR